MRRRELRVWSGEAVGLSEPMMRICHPRGVGPARRDAAAGVLRPVPTLGRTAAAAVPGPRSPATAWRSARRCWCWMRNGRVGWGGPLRAPLRRRQDQGPISATSYDARLRPGPHQNAHSPIDRRPDGVPAQAHPARADEHRGEHERTSTPRPTGGRSPAARSRRGAAPAAGGVAVHEPGDQTASAAPQRRDRSTQAGAHLPGDALQQRGAARQRRRAARDNHHRFHRRDWPVPAARGRERADRAAALTTRTPRRSRGRAAVGAPPERPCACSCWATVSGHACCRRPGCGRVAGRT